MGTEGNKTDEELLKIYNEIDAFMRQQRGNDAYADHTYLIQELSQSNRVIARHQQELRAIAQLRNILVHNPFTSISDPIAYASSAVVERYAQIRDALLKPHNALSIAIPASKIFSAIMDDNAIKVIRTMEDSTYTHVPILKDGKMIGVFSENTILSYLAKSGEGILTADMTIKEFAEHIPLDSHSSEVFYFLPRTASLAEVFDVFNKAIKQRVRIGMLFVTTNGKPGERPLGIITAWDLASPEFEL